MRSYGISDSIRILAPRIEITTYQCSGDESNLACSSGICSSHPRTFCATSDRQHNSVGLYQQTGWRGGGLGGVGSHSYTLYNLAVEIVLWCAKNRTHIKARHMPGRLNALADCLSRKENIVQTLNQRVTSQMFNICGTSHLDLFAIRLNRKLQLFMSPVADPEAYATDDLNLSWMGMSAYSFPPFPVILSCLTKIQNEECIVYMIAPLWEGQAWFPLLMSLAIAPPLLDCRPKKTLLPPYGILQT